MIFVYWTEHLAMDGVWNVEEKENLQLCSPRVASPKTAYHKREIKVPAPKCDH